MRSWERYAPLTGAAAVLLWVVGAFLTEKDDRPEGKDTAALVAWVDKNDTSLIAGAIVFGFGVLFFFWMLGSLRAAVQAREGPGGRLAVLGFGSGVATSVCLLMTYMPHAQAALDIDDTSPTSTDALIHMGDAFFGGVELFAIPMLLATALASLRYGVLPRWYAWASLVLALILAIPPIGWLGVFAGLPLWVLVTSVLLFRRSSEGRSSAPLRELRGN